jgi:hypothetical protein
VKVVSARPAVIETRGPKKGSPAYTGIGTSCTRKGSRNVSGCSEYHRASTRSDTRSRIDTLSTLLVTQSPFPHTILISTNGVAEPVAVEPPCEELHGVRRMTMWWQGSKTQSRSSHRAVAIWFRAKEGQCACCRLALQPYQEGEKFESRNCEQDVGGGGE